MPLMAVIQQVNVAVMVKDMSQKTSQKNMSIFDPHVHFFDLQAGQYDWLKSCNPPFWKDKQLINNNYCIDDLTLHDGFKLTGIVHVEAGFDNSAPQKELEWLSSLMLNKPHQYAAIAGANLQTSPAKFAQYMITLNKFKNVRGVRHIFDDNALELCADKNVLSNLRLLALAERHFELQFDISDTSDVNAVISLFSQVTELTVVINHAGFAPHYTSPAFIIWEQNLKRLAKLANVKVKCSGFEMVERAYDNIQMQHVISVCIKAFGEDAVMCASNFPLVLFSASYGAYWLQIDIALSNINANKTKLCSHNAAQLYIT